MSSDPTILVDFLQPLNVDITKIHALARSLCETFKHLAKESTNQFLPTPITEDVLKPEIEGKGRYLAIDIGGSNLRAAFIDLLGSSTKDGVKLPGEVNRELEKSWQIGEDHKCNNADEFFVWIGKCVAEVVQDGIDKWGLQQLPSELPMGVTMSFPMIQPKLSEAILMSMGKGFAIPPDLNLGQQLVKGYETSTASKPHLPRIKITAIVNDAVATLISFAHQHRYTPHQKAAMGLIVGTGCNATIPLSISKLPSSKILTSSLKPVDHKRNDTKIAINTEWSINGTAPSLHALNFITKWDIILDNNFDIPGFMPFEYMTGGKYLGELARLIILDYFITRLHMPLDSLPLKLREHNALDASVLAKVEREGDLWESLDREIPFPDDPKTGEPKKWTKDLAEALVQIAKKIEIRAAGMVAAAIVGLLAAADEISLPSRHPSSSSLEDHSEAKPTKESSQVKELLVGYTGSCIANFHDYLEDCQGYLDAIMFEEHGPDMGGKRIVLEACIYGSIIGAGILAGTVDCMEKEKPRAEI
ncbi:N-acetylglucosamine kinase 1 [Ciborinia camelliae]|nr:N-acetylglucosamine kinase 1 [Ciborinia camelliae]